MGNKNTDWKIIGRNLRRVEFESPFLRAASSKHLRLQRIGWPCSLQGNEKFKLNNETPSTQLLLTAHCLIEKKKIKQNYVPFLPSQGCCGTMKDDKGVKLIQAL